MGKETPSQNKDARHKAFVLCAFIPLLMLADGAVGSGHRAPLKLHSLGSQGFSPTVGVFIVGRFGSCRWWGWHEPRSPTCVRACGATQHTVCVTAGGLELPLKSFIHLFQPRAGRETGSAGLGCPNAWFHQTPMGGPWQQAGAAELVVWCFPIMNGSMLGLWASGGELCPSLQPS